MIARLRVDRPWRTWVEVAPDQWVERKTVVGLARVGPGVPSANPIPVIHRQGASNGRLTFRRSFARYEVATYPRSELDVKKTSRPTK